MKSFLNPDLFVVQVEYFNLHYLGLLFSIGMEANNKADGDATALVDYVSYYAALNVNALNAAFILTASKNANAFLQQPSIKEITWQDTIMAMAQYALEADVHAWLNANCQEDKSPSESVRVVQG